MTIRDPVREMARSLRQSMTPEEIKLWVRLRDFRKRGYHFRRQCPMGGYIVDFVCKQQKLIVEVDGSQHGEDRELEYDRARDRYFSELGFRTLRMWNVDVNRSPDDAADTVLAALEGGGSNKDRAGGETPPVALARATLPALTREEGER